MTIKVLADGADGYQLIGENGEVMGWVRGRAVGVTGFRCEEDAINAAVAAHRALADAAPRLGLAALPPIRTGPVRLVHDGSDRWVAQEMTPIARLLALPDRRLADAPCRHAFEVLLRGSRISDGAAIGGALHVIRALRPDTDSARIVWPAAKGLTSGPAATTDVRLEEP